MAIATWRSDLKKVLEVFKVSSMASLRPPFTLHTQTELEIDKQVTPSNPRHGVPDSQTPVSTIHHDVPKARSIVPSLRIGSNSSPPISVQNYGFNIRAVIPGVRSNALRNNKGPGGRNLAVNVIHTVAATV